MGPWTWPFVSMHGRYRKLWVLGHGHLFVCMGDTESYGSLNMAICWHAWEIQKVMGTRAWPFVCMHGRYRKLWVLEHGHLLACMGDTESYGSLNMAIG